MLLIDAGTKEERELSHYVFKSYIDSDDMSEYHAKLRIKIKETGLSINFLKRLRDVYVENYASASELLEYEQKKRYYNIKCTEYIAFVESVFEKPVDERFNYLWSKNLIISKVNYYFKLYEKKGRKYSSQVDSFLKQYTKYMEEVNEKEKNKKKLQTFNSACALFDEIISLGFYNISDYISQFPNEKQKRLQAKIGACRKLIMCEKPELWETYSNKLEDNRRRTFCSIQENIGIFNRRLHLSSSNQDNVDIIDYYLLIGIPIGKYKDLCKGYIDQYYLTLFNVFSYGFVKLENKIVEEKNILNSNYMFGDKVLSDDEKLFILNFLKEHNVPLGFYASAVKKYAEGGLDDYINICSKQKILNDNLH